METIHGYLAHIYGASLIKNTTGESTFLLRLQRNGVTEFLGDIDSIESVIAELLIVRTEKSCRALIADGDIQLETNCTVFDLLPVYRAQIKLLSDIYNRCYENEIRTAISTDRDLEQVIKLLQEHISRVALNIVDANFLYFELKQSSQILSQVIENKQLSLSPIEAWHLQPQRHTEHCNLRQYLDLSCYNCKLYLRSISNCSFSPNSILITALFNFDDSRKLNLTISLSFLKSLLGMLQGDINEFLDYFLYIAFSLQAEEPDICFYEQLLAIPAITKALSVRPLLFCSRFNPYTKSLATIPDKLPDTNTILVKFSNKRVEYWSKNITQSLPIMNNNETTNPMILNKKLIFSNYKRVEPLVFPMKSKTIIDFCSTPILGHLLLQCSYTSPLINQPQVLSTWQIYEDRTTNLIKQLLRINKTSVMVFITSLIHRCSHASKLGYIFPSAKNLLIMIAEYESVDNPNDNSENSVKRRQIRQLPSGCERRGGGLAGLPVNEETRVISERYNLQNNILYSTHKALDHSVMKSILYDIQLDRKSKNLLDIERSLSVIQVLFKLATPVQLNNDYLQIVLNILSHSSFCVSLDEEQGILNNPTKMETIEEQYRETMLDELFNLLPDSPITPEYWFLSCIRKSRFNSKTFENDHLIGEKKLLSIFDSLVPITQTFPSINKSSRKYIKSGISIFATWFEENVTDIDNESKFEIIRFLKSLWKNYEESDNIVFPCVTKNGIYKGDIIISKGLESIRVKIDSNETEYKSLSDIFNQPIVPLNPIIKTIPEYNIDLNVSTCLSNNLDWESILHYVPEGFSFSSTVIHWVIQSLIVLYLPALKEVEEINELFQHLIKDGYPREIILEVHNLYINRTHQLFRPALLQKLAHILDLINLMFLQFYLGLYSDKNCSGLKWNNLRRGGLFEGVNAGILSEIIGKSTDNSNITKFSEEWLSDDYNKLYESNLKNPDNKLRNVLTLVEIEVLGIVDQNPNILTDINATNAFNKEWKPLTSTLYSNHFLRKSENPIQTLKDIYSNIKKPPITEFNKKSELLDEQQNTKLYHTDGKPKHLFNMSEINLGPAISVQSVAWSHLVVDILFIITHCIQPSQGIEYILGFMNSELLISTILVSMGTTHPIMDDEFCGRLGKLLNQIVSIPQYQNIFLYSNIIRNMGLSAVIQGYLQAGKSQLSYYDARLLSSHVFRHDYLSVMNILLTSDNGKEMLLKYSIAEPENIKIFLTQLMNDVTYQYDEGLIRLAEHREGLSTETIDEEDLNDDGTDMYNSSRSAPGISCGDYIKRGNRCFDTLCIISKPLCHLIINEVTLIEQCFSGFLNPLLDRLFSHRFLTLRSSSGQTNWVEFNFRPTQLQTALLELYVLFANSDMETVVRLLGVDSGVELETLKRAERLVKKNGLLPIKELQVFSELVSEIELLYTSNDLVYSRDIPDEYLDPLIMSLMEDPVILPTSGTIMDRKNIERYLHLTPEDPFNREPLEIDQLLPATELKTKIDNWKLNIDN